jgi:hypothetical protein
MSQVIELITNIINSFDINTLNLEQIENAGNIIINSIYNHFPIYKHYFFELLELIFGPKHLIAQVALVVAIQTSM